MRKPHRSKNRFSALLAVAVLTGACTDGIDEPTGPDTNAPDAIELEVRMHVVQSDELDALNARLSDAEVTELLTAVNDIWSQAGIVWTLESVVREDARNESVFRDALMSRTVSPISVLTRVLTPDNLHPDIWNVFMIRDFGGTVGGVYLPIEKVVVSSEVDLLGQREIDGGMARILAHELGHSLGLVHVPCTAQGNLMAAGCLQGLRTFLDPTQVTRVRLQAEFGRPF